MANIEQAIRSSYSNLSGRGCYFLLARFSQGNEMDQLHASTHCASRVNSTVDEIRSPQACKVFVRATGRMTRIMEQIDGMWITSWLSRCLIFTPSSEGRSEGEAPLTNTNNDGDVVPHVALYLGSVLKRRRRNTAFGRFG